jgi:transposase
MDDNQWLIEFDASKAKFQWFFLQYGFEDELKRLEEARSKNQVKKMITIMNRVWFELPDGVFNIKMNPKGWDEFISLLEN